MKDPDKHYLISEASKKLCVESHVLRYWEEELELKVNRNEMGHRFYTEEDMETFEKIKELKKEGFGLKAIKKILKGEEKSLEVIHSQEKGVVVESLKLEQFKEMLADVINTSLKGNNIELKKDIGDAVSEHVIKEMNYLSRMKEEQDEARFRQLDENIRFYQRERAEAAATKEKKVHKWKLFHKKKEE